MRNIDASLAGRLGLTPSLSQIITRRDRLFLRGLSRWRRSCPGPVWPTGQQAPRLCRAARSESHAAALGRGLSQNTAVRPGHLLRSRVDGSSDFSLGIPMLIFQLN